ncbi:MAG: hypothetical protein LBT32_07395 [Peptococcaceae bacterium]|jgi:hypothetical protein|nr:hypothetical protein [Peptococcaceae bacterium]
MFQLVDVLSYGFFILCLALGWVAARALDYRRLLRQPAARWRVCALQIGATLVLAEGFRVFLSFVIGPLLDVFVHRSISGFKMF